MSARCANNANNLHKSGASIRPLIPCDVNFSRRHCKFPYPTIIESRFCLGQNQGTLVGILLQVGYWTNNMSHNSGMFLPGSFITITLYQGLSGKAYPESIKRYIVSICFWPVGGYNNVKKRVKGDDLRRRKRNLFCILAVV